MFKRAGHNSDIARGHNPTLPAPDIAINNIKIQPCLIKTRRFGKPQHSDNLQPPYFNPECIAIICCQYYQTCHPITTNNFTTIYTIMNKTMRTYSSKAIKQPRFRVTSHSLKKQPTPPHSHLSGTIVLGEYQAQRDDLMGVGANSKVYRGVSLKTGREVAFKIINLQTLTTLQRRFLTNEIQSLRKLTTSKHVIQLHQIIETKTQVAIVTELCRQSLYSIMAKDGTQKTPLEFAFATKVFTEVLFGYLEMRERGLVHRDIKPANIFMSLDGCAKLGDLGFAVSDQKLQADIAIKAGSPLYMAPEILKQNRYSAKADIWSLGIVLLEMLIGDLPWAHRQEQQLHSIVYTCNFGGLIPSHVEQKWRHVVLRCLEVDPLKRWAGLELMKFIDPDFEMSRLGYTREAKPQKKQVQKLRVRNYTEMQQTSQPDASFLPKQFVRSTKTKELKSKPFPKSSLNQRLTTTFEVYQNGQTLIDRKLARNQLSNQIGGDKRVGKQLKLRLSLARLAFRLVETLQSDTDNIHINCLNLDHHFQPMLATFISTTLEDVKAGKSCFGLKEVEQFKRTFEFRFLKEITSKYQQNYRSYFQLKLVTVFPPGKGCQTDELTQRLQVINQKGRNHLTIIYQEMVRSGLPEIYDEQICTFFKALEYISAISRSLRLMKTSSELFLKLSKLQQLLKKKSQTVYTLEHIQSILDSLDG